MGVCVGSNLLILPSFSVTVLLVLLKKASQSNFALGSKCSFLMHTRHLFTGPHHFSLSARFQGLVGPYVRTTYNPDSMVPLPCRASGLCLVHRIKDCDIPWEGSFYCGRLEFSPSVVARVSKTWIREEMLIHKIAERNKVSSGTRVYC